VTLQRKKSLPDVQQIPVNNMMSREEVSVLGSARREEVRRQKDESERYKANPLLYLVSPQVKVSVGPPRQTLSTPFSDAISLLSL
jgi:junctophilin